ncbi:hypothetical protein [Mesorhizobium sp. WSM3862]|uniref:hypothetical protein n=1 Tax=Mesorhizobium sp. WSM3862 TaxID=632858 RepID=UPI000BAF66B0|nr:hypothetical protein [Mesorhizobium sp. WSM3862]PBB98902.1 hypothetical protein CK224_04650 [Mesorhizobium sp. WSM3862]
MGQKELQTGLRLVDIQDSLFGLFVIHVWTAPVEQEDSDNGNIEAVRFIHVFGLFLCGLWPLAMMVSVDRALIKLPRCDAR